MAVEAVGERNGRYPDVRRTTRIAHQAAVALVAGGLIGCAYHGTLRPGFYSPPQTTAKLPLRAALVVGENLEALEYSAEAGWWGHSVHIKTHPALKQALTEASQSLFESVEVVRTAASQSSAADIVILPTVEMREHVLYTKLVAKEPNSGETLREYEASGNVFIAIPGSVRALAIINGVFCGLLTPIATPLTTELLGAAAEESLERRLGSNVRQMTEEIGNDRALVTKVKSVRSPLG